MALHTGEIEFYIFYEDAGWKIYREGELIAVYQCQAVAEAAATNFVQELAKAGRRAVVRVGQMPANRGETLSDAAETR